MFRTEVKKSVAFPPYGQAFCSRCGRLFDVATSTALHEPGHYCGTSCEALAREQELGIYPRYHQGEK